MGSCTSTGANGAASSSSSASFRRADGRQSKRVRAEPEWALGEAVTASVLQKRRDEFWDTRVGNDKAMWQSIRAASDALAQGDEDLANAIIDAANLTTPSGSLAKCYDELGAAYVVPPFAFSNPSDVVTDPAAAGPGGDATAEGSDSGAARKPVDLGSGLKCRCRVAPGERDFVVDVAPHANVLMVKAALEQHLAALPADEGKRTLPSSRMRFIFRGKELGDSIRIKDDIVHFDVSMVVQVFVRPADGPGKAAKKKR